MLKAFLGMKKTAQYNEKGLIVRELSGCGTAFDAGRMDAAHGRLTAASDTVAH